jgi:hypothetical protein
VSATQQDVGSAMRLVVAVADAIRELGEVPSGHLYARLMGAMSISTYENIIAILKRTGLVTETNYVLRWVGGAK